MSTFIVIYPKGDRSVLTVANITGTEYEKDDYALASRHEYINYDEAKEKAKSLAKENGLRYKAPHGEHDFLD